MTAFNFQEKPETWASYTLSKLLKDELECWEYGMILSGPPQLAKSKGQSEIIMYMDLKD